MSFFKKIFKSLHYYFFEIKGTTLFKLKYFTEKTLQFLVTVRNHNTKIHIAYPFLLNKDYIIENKIGKFFIKKHSDYDYPIQPYVEDDHDKYMDIGTKSIFLDIGGHVGIYSIKFRNQNKGRKIKIFSFEPHPETYKTLSKNIALNNLEDTIIGVNKGCFSKTTKVQFTNNVAKDAAISKIIENESPDNGIGIGIEIDVVAIDDFIKENNIDIYDIGFIKIDVEGLEMEVFKGMELFLSKGKDFKIVCEILDKKQQNKVFNYIEKFKIKMEKIDESNFLLFK